MTDNTAQTGGSAEHLLQDMSRDLSRWMANSPDAPLHAREAAAAIAQLAAQPVAWFCQWFNADGSPEWDQYHDLTDPMPADDEWEDRPPDRVTPLYAAPQPAAQPQSVDAQMLEALRAVAGSTVRPTNPSDGAALNAVRAAIARAESAQRVGLTEAEILRVFNGPGLSPSDRFKLHAALFVRIWRLCESVHQIGITEGAANG